MKNESSNKVTLILIATESFWYLFLYVHSKINHLMILMLRLKVISLMYNSQEDMETQLNKIKEKSF
jgi:hypothetical protein